MNISSRLNRILQIYNMSEDQFRAFMNLPYEEAMQAAHKALSGAKEYAFLVANNDNILGLPKHLMPKPPSMEDRLKQIYTDRIFEFYLMRFFHSCSESDFSKYIKIHGLDILERQFKKGKGVLILNSHYGLSHTVQIILSRLGYKVATIQARDFYEELGIQNQNISVEQVAGNFGARVIAVGCSVLDEGKLLHMTGEGVAKSSGRDYDFLRKKWHIPNGFAYMIERTGAICLPVLTSIDADGTATFSIKQRIAPNMTIDDRNMRIDKMVQRYVNILKTAWQTDPANIRPIIIQNYINL